ncbi:DinB family protein [Streptomyces sp. NPDC057403]|uniref:DinB family protein n=1 Tax=Streptomyces sp. NPDC057403 TaxID=3346119 RepID=UPI00367B75E8
MTTPLPPGPQAGLLRYLQDARDALLWKLEGLSEYDVRRPLTPTGTNLLGLVKHVTYVELGYLGDTFGRSAAPGRPWYGPVADDNSDMWASAEESRADIVDRYRQAWEHADATVAALPPDTVGKVPWWPADTAEITLHHALARVLADTQRHAGQADILREQLDGSAGRLRNSTNLPSDDPAWWQAYRHRLERTAREAADKT